MNDTLPAVRLVSINTDDIGDVENSPEAMQFAVKLSGVPPAGWTTEFEPLYAAAPLAPKPPVAVEGDTLQVVYLPRYTDRLQAFLDTLARVVAQANAELVKTHDLKTSDVREQKKAEFARALKQLNLPKQEA